MKILKGVTYSTFIIVLFILIINNTSVYADVLTGITLSDDEYDVEKVSKELFKDVEIRHSEYLYNYDDSADYIYTTFKNGGYAIYYKDTFELLEYSPTCNVDDYNNKFKKYYGGPNSYLKKEESNFIDLKTNKKFEIDNNEKNNISKEIRNKMKNKKKLRNDKTVYNYDNVGDYNYSMQTTNEDIVTAGDPKIDKDSLIRDLPIVMGTYIPDFYYFLHNPKHGQNLDDTCGAVSAQLLLNYHNYYSHRKIIDNKYLFGDSSEELSYLNPNYCEDPMTMTSATLGTKGESPSGNDMEFSFYGLMVDYIPGDCEPNTVRNGIRNYLDDRNKEITNDIDFEISYRSGFLLSSVDTSKVISEIDEGRPIILMMQQFLGGTNHYVVAYGYQDYTYPDTNETYSGFIVHFGYGSGALNIWINSSWVYSYVTLKINHEHNYNIDVGDFGSYGGHEYKCGECGHRTDEVIKLNSMHRYAERGFEILPGSFKTYTITFDNPGVKVFQTFGEKDTVMYLYDEYNNLLAENDDGGHQNNSLISYNVSAGTKYKIKVKLYTSTYTGRVKLGIAAYLNSISCYEDISGPYSPGYEYSSSTTSGAVTMLKLVSYTESNHTIYTTKQENNSSYTDMYMYVIDPLSYELCDFDDDSGFDYRQPQISLNMEAYTYYLVIISSYNISYSYDYTFHFD